MTEPPTFEILSLAVTHLPAIQAIEQEVFVDPWPASGFLEIASLSDRNWVVAAGGEVAAYLITQWVADEIHILNIAVAPARQRRGMGGRLLEFLIAHGRDAGMRDIYLEVRPSNAAALAMYEHRGFDRLALRKCYYPNGEDALVMHLQIDGTNAADEKAAAKVNRSGVER